MSAVTVMVPTLNEELHVQRAVESARDLGPVIVIDGGSTDRTTDLARAAGAHVMERTWRGYSEQKNWALDAISLETEWVLFLDADEYISRKLREEISAAISAVAADGYWIPRRNIFLGRVLRHAWWYPDYQLRLFRHARGRFESRTVHEHVVLDGAEGFLEEPLMHENLKGLEAFMLRQLRYARLEADEIMGRNSNGRVRDGKFLGTWPERRRALKTRVWYRLPGRPVVRFVWMYVIKRGFLDGRAGLIYCALLSFHEAYTNAVLYEARLRAPDAVTPPRTVENA